MLVIMNSGGAYVPSGCDYTVDDVIGRNNVGGLVLITVERAHNAHGGAQKNTSRTIDVVYEAGYWFFYGGYDCERK